MVGRKRSGSWATGLVLVLILLMPCRTWGKASEKPVSRMDFIHECEITGTGLDGAFHRFSIPIEVYGGLIQFQNHDLAIFDSNGEIVPFTVVSDVTDSEAIPVRSEVSLPFFELPRENRDGEVGGTPTDISVRIDADVRVVELREGRVHDRSFSDRRYLLDLASIFPGGDPNSYRLDLRGSGDVELNAKVDVFRSDNLRDWSTVCRGIPLIRLRRGDARLDSGEIELLSAPGRYLVLGVRGAGSAFSLTEVRCSFLVRQGVSEDEFAEFDGVLAPDHRVVEYDLGGAFPVTRLDFVLREPGLYRASCSSRSEPGMPWRAAGEAVLFRVRESNSDGTFRANSAISIGRREDRYWRLDFGKKFSAPPPRLRIGWHSGTVYFLTQGRAPWILAFGSTRKDLMLQTPHLLRNLHSSATMETVISASLAPKPDKEGRRVEHGRLNGAEWQRWLVWSLLILGALLLSGIAWRLLRSGSGSKN
ncbi:MAG: hypothetical protein CSA35_08835 [Dethiosulfovibrio peptidovorans]|nr:MAG: hypothetical protein CSA35_08835 [Dethiosulfovibrio peptidovorans]